MDAQKQFQTATLLFYENKLEEALLAINRSIDLKPANSVAYSNRALINFHLGRITPAEEDLATALALNPLNYAAYFNLSSIGLRSDNYISFLRNIECGIAALRLIFGRMRKDRGEILASLQACSNNVDALTLLLLMEVEKENFSEALKLIDKYGPLQQDKLMAKRVRENLAFLAERYSVEREEEFYDLLELDTKKDRLRCSANLGSTLIEEDIQPAIQTKLQQFNKYYQLVSNSLGKVNHIPKSNEKYMLLENLPLPKGKGVHFSAQVQMIASH